MRAQDRVNSREVPDPDDLIALARIARYGGRPNLFRYTTRGDGLSELPALPLDVWLYWPPASEKDLSAPAVQGLDADCRREQRLQAAYLASLKPSTGSGSLELWQAPHQPWPTPDRLPGTWLCVPRALLKLSEDRYFRFELLGLPVESEGAAWGRVTNYFETAAHGILEIEANDGEQVLVPFVAAYVTVDREARRVIASGLDDFRGGSS